MALKAVGGALLLVLIPEIAALPDAVAQAGNGAEGGGVISHFLRKDDGLRSSYSINGNFYQI